MRAFDPVDTTSATDGQTKDEVESPSLSNSNAIARFEFEAGHGQEGTKILMVEWEDDDNTRNVRGDWHISWEGKSTVLPADDQTSSEVNRLYFLLPPGVAVPPAVRLTHRPADASKPVVTWQTNSLPAIFPPELGASARQAGKKGVLHTIWAKRRLQALQKEIDTESQNNVEGIGFAMAMQEQEWIEQNFGSAVSGGGRLMEKLKGLKIGTSEQELAAAAAAAATTTTTTNPLSPESSDVAVSSFSAFKGEAPAALGTIEFTQTRPTTTTQSQSQPPRRVATAVPPPAAIAQQQSSGMASLDAFTGGFAPMASSSKTDDEKEDDLFAMPISPRSPEMTKSPFSFAASDTLKYSQKTETAS
ncbi:uncharacterized protein IWZ02DRAFT_472285 [Phyllosticta citriasiana]|uniref:uncharacterized protein n=1 Tax=Phyllosticta citriasiana TaxID=595635 RepID=UPI0030FD391C